MFVYVLIEYSISFNQIIYTLEHYKMTDSKKKTLELIASHLPLEMIEYEIKARGIEPHDSVSRKKSQFVRMLTHDFYEYSPPIDLQNDLALCRDYINRWKTDLESKTISQKTLISSILCSEVLQNRLTKLKEINIDLSPEDGSVMYGLLLAIKCFIEKLSQLKTNTSTAIASSPKNDLNLTSRLMDDTLTNFLSGQKTPPIQSLPICMASLREALSNIQVPNENKDSCEGAAANGRPSLNDAYTNTFLPLQNRTFLPRKSDRFNNLNEEKNFSRSPTKIEIWKWNLKYSGSCGPDYTPVSEFLRRVEDLAISRNASHKDLFQSAAEFFEGIALKWYRSGMASGAFSSWEQLCDSLLNDFELYDYGENLLEHIKNRLQGESESIVTYFAIMEDLFLKLDFQLSEDQKVALIRRNLLPGFVRALSLKKTETVAILKGMCKVLEADFKRTLSRV